METEWKKVEEELPPVNTLVRVRLTNKTEAVDFVNEPVDKETPFQHYLVTEWRPLTREELCTIVRKLKKRNFVKTRKCWCWHYRKVIGEKEGDGTVEDISSITKEELDKISKKTALGKNDEVKLSPDDWIEEDGIRYLKKPLKVHFIPWDHYTWDCTSITSEHYDPEFLYIYLLFPQQRSQVKF